MYYGTHFCIKIDDFITNNVINYNIHCRNIPLTYVDTYTKISSYAGFTVTRSV